MASTTSSTRTTTSFMVLLHDTIELTKELLVLQGLGPHICQLVKEEEAERFLLANSLNIQKAAEGLARRVKALDRFTSETWSGLDLDKLKSLLPMYWAKDPAKAVLFVSFSNKSFDAVQFRLAASGSHAKSGCKVFFEWFGERIAARCAQSKQTQVTLIIDLTDAPLGQTTTSDFDQLVRIGSSYLLSMHPERLRQVYFVNAPSTFPMMMFTLKRVCNAETLKKFVVLDAIYKLPANLVPLEFIPRAMGGSQKTEWTDADSFYSSSSSLEGGAVSGVSSNATTTKGTSSSGAPEVDPLVYECEQLLKMLKTSIETANECEKRHLEENARLRKKVMAADRESLQEQEMDPEELQLRADLMAAMDQRDAYRRAVAFAKNFIDQEVQEREEFRADIEREIEQKRKENLAMVDALKTVFGSDAPNLFL